MASFLFAGYKTKLVGCCHALIIALLFAAFKGTLPRKWSWQVSHSPSRDGTGQARLAYCQRNYWRRFQRNWYNHYSLHDPVVFWWRHLACSSLRYHDCSPRDNRGLGRVSKYGNFPRNYQSHLTASRVIRALTVQPLKGVWGHARKWLEMKPSFRGS